MPEISEKFNIILDSVVSHDGVESSSSYSGASIDERNRRTDFEIIKGDEAHGVLQV